MCARYVCKSAEHKINLWLPSGPAAAAAAAAAAGRRDRRHAALAEVGGVAA